MQLVHRHGTATPSHPGNPQRSPCRADGGCLCRPVLITGAPSFRVPRPAQFAAGIAVDPGSVSRIAKAAAVAILEPLTETCDLRCRALVIDRVVCRIYTQS